jgi:hypothetical protein
LSSTTDQLSLGINSSVIASVTLVNYWTQAQGYITRAVWPALSDFNSTYRSCCGSHSNFSWIFFFGPTLSNVCVKHYTAAIPSIDSNQITNLVSKVNYHSIATTNGDV